MAINYNLSIGNVTKKFAVGEFSDVIVNVSVSVSAYSEEHPEINYNCGTLVQLDTESLDESTFLDFNSITKDVVIQWLLQSEGVESIEEYSYVKSSIENVQMRVDVLQQEEVVNVNWVQTNNQEITPEPEGIEDPSVLEA